MELIVNTAAWDNLCPIFNSLNEAQIGGVNSLQKAENLTTALIPNS